MSGPLDHNEAPALEMPAHVRVLSPGVKTEFPEQWYDLNSNRHFWFEWRWRVLRRVFRSLRLDLSVAARAFDIGCGTGILRDQVEPATAWTIDGADLCLDALGRTRPGRGQLYLYDIFECRPEFAAAYDYVFLFDVLEHVEPTGPFIDCVLSCVRPGGLLLINVPALEMLRSQYDTAAGHHRRYTIASLGQEFAGRPVRIEMGVYWGCALVPLLLARKLALRRVTDTGDLIRRGFEPPAAWINAGLQRLSAVETALLRRPPFGSSVLMAVRKEK